MLNKRKHKYSIERTEEELKRDAYLRVLLSGQVRCNPRYQTLFYGLKKNDPRQISVFYPFIYLMRRVVYVVLILFMAELPFISVVILLLWCLATLCLIWTEAQWEDVLINVQHAVNEIALYLILVQLSIFCGLTPTPHTALILGWTLITTIILTVFFNLLVITYMSICWMRLLCIRFFSLLKQRQLNRAKLQSADQKQVLSKALSSQQKSRN